MNKKRKLKKRINKKKQKKTNEKGKGFFYKI